MKVAAGVLLGTVVWAEEAKRDTSARTISRTDAEAYFRVLRRLDPKATNYLERLETRAGIYGPYSPADVQWAIDLKRAETVVGYDPKKIPPRGETVPAGAFDAAEVQSALQAHALKSGKAADFYSAALEKKFGKHAWYLATEVRDVQESGDKDAKRAALDLYPPIRPGWQPSKWAKIKMRQTWVDALQPEDPTLAEDVKTKIGDLVGATFSFARDYKKDDDTWTAVGTISYPLIYRNEAHPLIPMKQADPAIPKRKGKVDFAPEIFVIAPSISVNKQPNADPTKAMDAVYYRLGMLSEWLVYVGDNDDLGVELRGALVQGTDTAHKATMPAYELALEPKLFHSWGGATPGSKARHFGLGYRTVLLPKQPENVEQTDYSRLDLQLRGWWQLEGGKIQRVGAKWNAVEGEFLRHGPAAQLRINAPTLFRGVSLTGTYSHFTTKKGLNTHDDLLKLSLSFTLLQEVSVNPIVPSPKISLTADYLQGGLDFTKQEVETTTVGLSLLF